MTSASPVRSRLSSACKMLGIVRSVANDCPLNCLYAQPADTPKPGFSKIPASGDGDEMGARTSPRPARECCRPLQEEWHIASQLGS